MLTLRWAVAPVLCALSVGSVASAATLDLTDGTFTTITDSILPGDPTSFSETSDGVTFTFDAGANQRFTGGLNSGIVLGGGGGSLTSFDLTVDTDITLDGYAGLTLLGNTDASFDVSGAGVASTGNSFGTSGFAGSTTPGSESFDGGALSLDANETYTFVVTNPGVATTSYITSLDFTVVDPGDPTAVIPLPAGFPLLLAGLGAFAIVRRRGAQSLRP